MFVIKQPSCIIFGTNSISNFKFPEKCLVVTSKGSKKRGWITKLCLQDFFLFEEVEPNPSIQTANKIINEFQNHNFSHVIGLGGGSCLDVAKYVATKIQKKKILIPTTFGSGSEVTRIAVLKVEGNKKSFHDDQMFADVALVDPQFISNTQEQILKNSAIDACAQCTEAYDSLNSNPYTRFLCEKAFEILEDALLNKKYERLPLGSLISGLGFGNSSTTLGHALSYVFSNEGIPHGHALAFSTTVAHKFNNSKFYERFKNIVQKLNFSPISLETDLNKAAEIILTDKKHLDNNPKKIQKEDIMTLLNLINSGKAIQAV